MSAKRWNHPIFPEGGGGEGGNHGDRIGSDAVGRAEREFPCDCCDSDEEHDAAREQSLREFLSNCGPAPAHFTEEQAERAMRGIEKARKERGL